MFFDQTKIKSAKCGDLDSEILSGVIELCDNSASILSDYFGVVIEVGIVENAKFKPVKRYPKKSHSKGKVWGDSKIPPLTSRGDGIAVRLAITAGLVELVRNACNHLQDHRGAWLDPSPVVRVLVENGDSGSFSVIVSNPILGNFKARSEGARLTDQLLKGSLVGEISQSVDESKSRLLEQNEYGKNEYYCEQLVAHPIELYEMLATNS